MPGTARLRITRPLPRSTPGSMPLRLPDPVLAGTCRDQQPRELEDDVDAHQLTGLVTSDPLMSLQRCWPLPASCAGAD